MVISSFSSLIIPILNVDSVLSGCCPRSCSWKAVVYHDRLFLHCDGRYCPNRFLSSTWSSSDYHQAFTTGMVKTKLYPMKQLKESKKEVKDTESDWNSGTGFEHCTLPLLRPHLSASKTLSTTVVGGHQKKLKSILMDPYQQPRAMYILKISTFLKPQIWGKPRNEESVPASSRLPLDLLSLIIAHPVFTVHLTISF